MLVSLIVAADEKNGIGNGNDLLCHLPADLKYFKQKTTGHHMLMGRKTFASIGKALPNRITLIVSRSEWPNPVGTHLFHQLEEAIQFAANAGEAELFITGGGEIYRQTLPLADKVYLTRIHDAFPADTFFPELNPEEWLIETSEFHEKDDKNRSDHTFIVYRRKR